MTITPYTQYIYKYDTANSAIWDAWNFSNTNPTSVGSSYCLEFFVNFPNGIGNLASASALVINPGVYPILQIAIGNNGIVFAEAGYVGEFCKHNTPVLANTWYHFAYIGTNSVTYAFQNGVPLLWYTDATLTTQTATPTHGGPGGGGGYSQNGTLALNTMGVGPSSPNSTVSAANLVFNISNLRFTRGLANQSLYPLTGFITPVSTLTASNTANNWTETLLFTDSANNLLNQGRGSVVNYSTGSPTIAVAPGPFNNTLPVYNSPYPNNTLLSASLSSNGVYYTPSYFDEVSVSTPGSITFNGNNQFLFVDYSNSPTLFNFGTGTVAPYVPFCFEAWVYPTSYTNKFTIINRYLIPGGANPPVFAFYINSANNIVWQSYASGTFTLNPTTLAPPYSIPLNSWTHVALTRDSSANYKMFVNGYVVATTTNTAATLANTNTESFIYIGRAQNANLSFHATGSLTGLRVSSGIPTPYQTTNTTIGTRIFTPSTTPPNTMANTVLLINPYSQFPTDSSGTYSRPTTNTFGYNTRVFNSVNTISSATNVNGPAAFSTNSPYVKPSYATSVSPNSAVFKVKDTIDEVSLSTGSIAFNRTGYLNVTDSPVLSLANLTFTIEGWFNTTDTTTVAPQVIMARGQANAIVNNTGGGWAIIYHPYYGIFMYFNQSGPQNPIRVYNSGNTGYVTSNTWFHYAAVGNGTSISMYINGNQMISLPGYSNTSLLGIDPGVPLYIGYDSGNSYQANSNGMIQGSISNLRISNNVVYTANFVPSKLPFYSNSTTQFLLNCINANTIYYRDDLNIVTPVGTISYSNSSPFNITPNTALRLTNTGMIQVKGGVDETTISTGSLYFNNTAFRYVMVPPSTSYNLGSNNFTIEGFVYFSSFDITSSNQIIIEQRSNNSYATGDWLVYATNNSIVFTGYDYSNSYASVVASTGLVSNNWYHFAVMRNGATIGMYINGIQTQTNTAVNLGTNNNRITIGADQGSTAARWFLNGYLSNLRIINGSLAYSTPSFTAPASPLTAIPNTSFLMTTPYNSNELLNVSNSTVYYSSNGFANSYIAFPMSSPNNYNLSPAPFSNNNPFGIAQKDIPGSIYVSTNSMFYAPIVGKPVIGTGDFTMECFWHPTLLNYAANNSFVTNIMGVTARIELNWDGGTNTIVVAVSTTANVPILQGGVPGQTSNVIIGTPPSSNSLLNTWNHVAISRTSNTLRLFLNGTMLGSTTDNNNYINDSYYCFNQVLTNYSAYISNFRHVIGRSLYNADTSFTPPTAPLIAVANTATLYNMNYGAGYYNDTISGLPLINIYSNGQPIQVFGNNYSSFSPVGSTI